MPISLLLALISTGPAGAATPLQVTTTVTVERPLAMRDGTTRTVAVAGTRARPGDRLLVALACRNAGRVPIADLMLADPVPRELAYRGPATGTPEPDVSVDGRAFAPLAALRVPIAAGTRPAGPDDVVAVRWRIAGALAPGSAARLSFRAVLR